MFGSFRFYFNSLLFILTSIFFFWNFSWAQQSNVKLKVVVTFSVLGDMVRQIGSDLVDVKVIVPENADPHIYQPTPKDALLIAQADLVIRNGLGFEGWIDRLIDNSGYKGPYIIAAKKVTPRTLTTTIGFGMKAASIPDPHAWHCVKNGILYVQEISAALKAVLPKNVETIDKNEKKYIKDLQELDKWIHQQYSSFDKANRIVITTHDAFWYYGNSYGIQFLSPVGISTNAEPAASAVAQLIRDIKEKNIRAVFIENLSGRKLIEDIAKETGISIGGVLYADSLSDPKDDKGLAKTYIDMIRHNTQTIANSMKR